MNITNILAELKSERDRIDQAITAIEPLSSTGHRHGRTAPVTSARKRRRISAAARARLSRLMKERWAQGKMKPKTKPHPAEASTPERRMSAAGRKKISEAAKRRWIEWRRMQKKPIAKAGASPSVRNAVRQ